MTSFPPPPSSQRYVYTSFLAGKSDVYKSQSLWYEEPAMYSFEFYGSDKTEMLPVWRDEDVYSFADEKVILEWKLCLYLQHNIYSEILFNFSSENARKDSKSFLEKQKDSKKTQKKILTIPNNWSQ